MRRLSLARTLRLALVGLTVVLTTIAATGVAALYDARQDYEDDLAAGLELQASAARLLAAGVVEEATLRTAAGANRATAHGRARAAYEAAQNDAEVQAAGDPESERLVTDAGRLQARLRETDAPADAALAAREPITDLANRQRVRIREARNAARDASRRALLAVVIGGGLALLGAVGLVAAVLHAVRRPLDDLVSASGRLASGNLDARVDEDGPDELRELGRSFNAMADDLGRARERIEGERRRLETTVRSLGDGLIIVDAEGVVTAANPRAAQLVPGLRAGASPEQAGFDLPELEDALGEEVMLDREGMVLAVTAARLEEGEGVVWTLRDASERARLERLKSEFVATASHELRSPLTSIKGFVELLASSEDLAPRHREFVEIVHLSTNRLVDLVNDLLDVARIEAGRVDVHRRPTELGEVVGEVVTLLHPRIVDKHQQLDIDITEGLPRALADPARMRQVVTNLLTNAHLYTPEGGHIRVTVRDAKPGIQIAVADTGPGLNAEQREHIFDRFYRTADASSRAPGTGLGLSIVRSLVDLHQGTIELDSTPGQGATFTVTIPRAPTAVPQPDLRDALRGRRVLVLDDEQEIAELIARRLEPFGVEAAIAHSGEEALARLREEHFDAVTVDILMPGMTGFEVLRSLRADPDLRDIPAVVVSVFSGREALSGEWVVSKPIDAEELADALGAAVLAGRVRVIVAGREDVRGRLGATLDELGIAHEWACEPADVRRLCDRYRFEVALVDASMPDVDAVIEHLRLRGRRLRNSVILFSDGDTDAGFARLDAEPVPLADAGVTVLAALEDAAAAK